MGYDTVVLLSGGLDSMVLAYDLAHQGKKFRCLYFDAGKNPSMPELHCAKHTAFALNAPLEIVDITGILRLASGYIPPQEVALDDYDCGHPSIGIWPKLQLSGITMLLSISTYFAEITQINSLTLAIIKEQADSRPHSAEFFATWPQKVGLLSLGPPNQPLNIQLDTPYINMKKADVIKRGVTLNVPLALSWSCLRGGHAHDGTCGNCLQRKHAFNAAGVVDPTAYEH